MLRVKQFEVAINGSIPMLIWLGKQRLGQAEKAQATPEWLARLLEQFGVHVAQAVAAMKFDSDIENRLLTDIETRWRSVEG